MHCLAAACATCRLRAGSSSTALMQPCIPVSCRRQSSLCQTVHRKARMVAVPALLVRQQQLQLQLQQMPLTGSILRTPGRPVLMVIRAVRSMLHARHSPSLHSLTSRQHRHSALCQRRRLLHHLQSSSLSCQQAASRQSLGHLQELTLQQAASLECLGQTLGASQRLPSQCHHRSSIWASSRPRSRRCSAAPPWQLQRLRVWWPRQQSMPHV